MVKLAKKLICVKKIMEAAVMIVKPVMDRYLGVVIRYIEIFRVK